jgi:hypothetical protein
MAVQIQNLPPQDRAELLAQQIERTDSPSVRDPMKTFSTSISMCLARGQGSFAWHKPIQRRGTSRTVAILSVPSLSFARLTGPPFLGRGRDLPRFLGLRNWTWRGCLELRLGCQAYWENWTWRVQFICLCSETPCLLSVKTTPSTLTMPAMMRPLQVELSDPASKHLFRRRVQKRQTIFDGDEHNLIFNQP